MKSANKAEQPTCDTRLMVVVGRPRVDAIGNWLMSCWYGGAFSMPFGFFLGLLWQIHASVDILAAFRWHVVGYGLFAAVMPAFAAFTTGVWSRVPAA